MLLALTAVIAVLVAAGAVYQLIGARRDARRFPPPGSLVDAGGYRLHAACSGSGSPTVIFDSGVAASSLSWVRVARDVATFTRACSYDRAGLGWSDPPRGPRSVARMVDELAAVAEHASGGAPAVFVGHSFGAFLVCAYAARHPEAVAGLVLVDPPSDWHDLTPRQAFLLRGGVKISHLGVWLARLGVVRASLALLTGGAPGVPRNFVRMFGQTASGTLERLVGEVRKLPEEVHPLVSAIWCQPKCFRAMGQHIGSMAEIAEAVARISSLPNVPVVVISSGKQPTATLSRQRRLAELSPQGRQVIASRSGHWIPFDEPELIVEVVRQVVVGQ